MKNVLCLTFIQSYDPLNLRIVQLWQLYDYSEKFKVVIEFQYFSMCCTSSLLSEFLKPFCLARAVY